jgi:hypothetical protein
VTRSHDDGDVTSTSLASPPSATLLPLLPSLVLLVGCSLEANVCSTFFLMSSSRVRFRLPSA